MLLSILDGNAVAQTVIVAGQEAPVDRSGAIAGTSVAQSLLAANLTRSGYFLQNLGANPMYINELGSSAVAGQGSVKVVPGATFPLPGMPLTTAALSIVGTAGDAFTAREW